MYFELSKMARGLLRKYTVKRVEGYTMNSPQGKITRFDIKAVIYKGSDRKRDRDTNTGGKITATLKGKTFKYTKLEEGDIIEIEGINFIVSGVTPRIYSDFVEFTLEGLVSNG